MRSEPENPARDKSRRQESRRRCVWQGSRELELIAQNVERGDRCRRRGEKEKESEGAWPGPRSSAHANETLLHSEIAKIAPADRPPVRPVGGSIVCDVGLGPLITFTYVREGEIQNL